MARWRPIHSFFALLSTASLAVTAPHVDAGFDVFAAAQAMINLASKSWETGTATQALLELYNPELSVFGANPFPNGNVPTADPAATFALRYAKQFISTLGQILVPDDAVGDPASLGVSAIMIGKTEIAYREAADRQADFLLNMAPKYSNGAISHRTEVAELWADNLAMSFPFLAYLAVETNNPNLMTTTFTQCRLQREVLKVSWFLNWRHIIGPSGARDEGLWSTGNGWAGYGLVRVLHTMQRWPRSAGMTSEITELKNWIKEILDGAMLSGFDDGLLRNYLNDDGWFGEVAGTSLLTAIAYRMAVNDPVMFPQRYITWADANRQAVARHQRSDGILSPAVNPYNWHDRNKFTTGSPEAQAFAVHLYTAYRDCVLAKVCQAPASPTVTTISAGGIGPYQFMTMLGAPVTYSDMPAPTTPACSSIRPSCDASDCLGSFNGLGNVRYARCTQGPLKGCECLATPRTCGPHASCDSNGCAGSFNGLGNVKYPQCTGNFVGCECTVTPRVCGPMASCDNNGCAGSFNGLGNVKYPQCTGNFAGCNCTITPRVCGGMASCDDNGCAGSFNGLGNVKYPQCTGNFAGCNCTVTPRVCGPRASCDNNGCAGSFNLTDGIARCSRAFETCECLPTQNTCGNRQSCDAGNCNGGFTGLVALPTCQNFFRPCQCNATPRTCGTPQDCDLNGCRGNYNWRDGKAYCTGNFIGCECRGNANTCGRIASCDDGNCQGAFWGNVPDPQCTAFFRGCKCLATSNTCGPRQRCDLNGCEGAYDSAGVARCRGNFVGCACNPTESTCPSILCSQCNGGFLAGVARCRERFTNCPCTLSNPPGSICPSKGCFDTDCDGSRNGDNGWTCKKLWRGCPCSPPAAPAPTDPDPDPPAPPSPVFTKEWYCLGQHEEDFGMPTQGGSIQRWFGLTASNMLTGKRMGDVVGLTGVAPRRVGELCGKTFDGFQVVCHGDIEQRCSDYGVATFAGRRCRTYCPQQDGSGSGQWCKNWFQGIKLPGGGNVISNYDHMDLVCNVL